ncbi:MAG TPA: hypothetical protein VJT32_08995 [bacterium]|nr:hypothetical protein [bacterium]
MDINTASGEAAGIAEEKFVHLDDYATSPLFSALERLVLQYADGMTITGRDVPDELFATLRTHFSEEEMVELTAHVAFENFRSKFNHALRIEAQGFCRIPRVRSTP